jgi:hypothetical protein
MGERKREGWGLQEGFDSGGSGLKLGRHGWAKLGCSVQSPFPFFSSSFFYSFLIS